MKISKNVTILAIILLLILGIFLVVRYFNTTKKTTNISVATLAQDDGTTSNQDNIETPQVISDNVANDVTTAELKNTEKTDVAPESSDSKVSVPVEQKKNDSASSPNNEVKTSSGKIVSKLVSWGFAKASDRKIEALIVHTSYNNLGGDVFDFDKVIQEWKDAGVSPHYAIDRDGTIYQLVADQNKAFHAGVSKLPDGTTDVNSVSIGVEVINSQDGKFTDAQYAGLNSLIGTLKKKYAIKYILGHDEIAPGRKTDPWGIDWKKVNR